MNIIEQQYLLCNNSFIFSENDSYLMCKFAIEEERDYATIADMAGGAKLQSRSIAEPSGVGGTASLKPDPGANGAGTAACDWKI
ncbi:hypothetical protein [Sporomusa aerivorans]|uniref:hypothetical protein n=1 Tax=Sporomusa aerivorans TaxID=204936 RepID=UPI003529EB54